MTANTDSANLQDNSHPAADPSQRVSPGCIITFGKARMENETMAHAQTNLRKSALSWGLAGALLFATTAFAQASDTWTALKPDVFGDRVIHDGSAMMTLDAPKRPDDQSNVPVGVTAKLNDGRTIKRVVFIVDENPSPVAADFELGQQRTAVSLRAMFRFNRGTDVRAVIEASDGQLYMTARHVKFAGGQAACSAPPNGDPAEIAANMGKMTLAHKTQGTGNPAVSSMRRSANVTVSHPNHTGMVLDQISLLYIPIRIVTDLEVSQGDERVFAMRGSMTLAQDPSIEFDYRPNGADKVVVTLKDSEQAQWSKEFPVGPAS